MVIIMTIGERIKALRCNRGISQSGLGSLLGIKQTAVSMIEKGTNQPTVSQIEVLARYFAVSTDYLILGSEDTATPVERDILREIREDAAVYNALMTRITSKKTISALCA